MPWYPGAIRKEITANKGRKRLTVWNRVNLHIAVSNGDSLFSYFNQSGIPDSHFFVRHDGAIEQYVSTDYNAFADLEGNDATISIETAGMGTGTWSPAQLESLAKLYAWAVKTHGIARKLATSSKTGTESKGLSWHRLGVDGNFPSLPNIRAGRLQRGGGMRYSTSAGKACPGDDRIPQIPGIFDRALVILDGDSTPTAPKEKVLMAALTEAEQQEMLITSRQVEIVVRRIETEADERRELDLAHMAAATQRQTDALTKLDRIEAKLDQLLAEDA